MTYRPFLAWEEWEWQISTGGGVVPRWRADGHEIFYLKLSSLGAQLMAASVNATSTAFQVGAVQPLFSFSLTPASIVRSSVIPNTPGMPYDVSRDGQRFLVIARGEQKTTVPPTTVVINWIAGLKK
jgi:hypothetical protein